MSSDDFLDTILGDDTGKVPEELEATSGHGVSQVEADEDEALYPLLDCIKLINDEGMRQFVRAVLLEAPAVFWTQPANTAETLSPLDERLDGGMVLRVERMARACLYIANAHGLSHYEEDLMIAAALIHAVTRFVPTQHSVQQDPMYPYTVDSFVQQVRYEYATQHEQYTLGESDDSQIIYRSSPLEIEEEDLMTIMRLIRCHRGQMSPIPETIPVTTLEWAFHVAYYVVCNLHFIVDGDDIKESRWVSQE